MEGLTKGICWSTQVLPFKAGCQLVRAMDSHADLSTSVNGQPPLFGQLAGQQVLHMEQTHPNMPGWPAVCLPSTKQSSHAGASQLLHLAQLQCTHSPRIRSLFASPASAATHTTVN
jgi:hypothetical protein